MSCLCLLCGAGLPNGIVGVPFWPVPRRNRLGAILCDDCRDDFAPISGEVCLRCGRPLISEIEFCTACRERSVTLSNRGALEYRGRPRELITLYKLSGQRRIATVLGDILLGALGGELQGSILVPVPASPERRRLLGWDPVLELALRLVAPLGLEVRCLLSRKPGRQQKELGYLDRIENATRLFEYAPVSSRRERPRRDPGAKPLVLFDDIYTTGATMAVCREILQDAGLQVARSFTLAVD